MLNKKDSKTQAMAMKLAQLNIERIEPKAKYETSEILGDLMAIEVPIPDKFRKAVKVQNKISKRHEAAMNHHAELYRQANDHFWGLVRASLPDLDFEKYQFTIHKEKLILTCTGVNKK